MVISNMPREMTRRERLGDAIYLQLQMLARLLLLPAAILGFYLGSVAGALAGLLTGYLAGRWVRHSLGMRGPDPTLGFFRRMRERAEGSRPRVLERLLEAIRGNRFTPEKCRAIWQAYERAGEELRGAQTREELYRILNELDQVVKRHSYD